MQITNISTAKASLSKLIERALRGEEVIIGKAGKPIVKLVPYDLDPAPRQLGVGNWKGKIWIADDFDASSDEILALFEGESDESVA
jgi:prevent-host-death family protein